MAGEVHHQVVNVLFRHFMVSQRLPQLPVMKALIQRTEPDLYLLFIIVLWQLHLHRRLSLQAPQAHRLAISTQIGNLDHLRRIVYRILVLIELLDHEERAQHIVEVPI